VLSKRSWHGARSDPKNTLEQNTKEVCAASPDVAQPGRRPARPPAPRTLSQRMGAWLLMLPKCTVSCTPSSTQLLATRHSTLRPSEETLCTVRYALVVSLPVGGLRGLRCGLVGVTWFGIS